MANGRNGMDVDKWDFIARDCQHLGTYTIKECLITILKCFFKDCPKTSLLNMTLNCCQGIKLFKLNLKFFKCLEKVAASSIQLVMISL